MRVEQNNQVQQFSALNAFKSNRVTKPEGVNGANENAVETSDGTKAAPKGLLERVDLQDIRKCAGYVGEFDISDEEIKYGLMYGRSVIAEWLC